MFLLVAQIAQGQIIQFKVENNQVERVNGLVSAQLEGTDFNPDQEYMLFEVVQGNNVEIPYQLEPGNQWKIWWIMPGKTSVAQTRNFNLKPGEARNFPELHFQKGDSSLIIGTNPGNAILQYNHALTPPPAGTDPLFIRSGYIHPLYTPGGFELTTIHPADHIHHMGIWNPWTKTSFEGREIDFWNLYKGEGTVRFKEYLHHYNGQVYSGFSALHDHLDLKAPGGERSAMQEVWDVRVLKPVVQDRQVVDFISTLNCATESPIVLEEYRYAGFGFRANPYWTNQNSSILTSEGKTRKDGDATKARWCKITGDTGSGRAGILFLSHPFNRTHPEAMRIWPEDANNGRGDVFFQFCPIRDQDWPLEPGKLYSLKYRMVTFDGEMEAEEAERIWQDYAFPVKVIVNDVQ